MRILAVADIHNENVKLRKADLTIIAGDFTNRGPISFVERFLDGIENEVLAIPGNMDPKEVFDVLERRGVSIHCRVVDFKGVKIFGFGGSSPTPFNTPIEFEDEEIEKYISNFESDIAVFHDTPHGFFDWINGRSVGSMAIKRWIERVKPKIVFSAHIHEHEGVAKFNDTLIIKIPPCYERRGVLVEFDDLDCVVVRFVKL
jgi:Icc-related predicted phosphoesterase